MVRFSCPSRFALLTNDITVTFHWPMVEHFRYSHFSLQLWLAMAVHSTVQKTWKVVLTFCRNPVKKCERLPAWLEDILNFENEIVKITFWLWNTFLSYTQISFRRLTDVKATSIREKPSTSTIIFLIFGSVLPPHWDLYFQILGGGCAARFSRFWPYFTPKNVIFQTRFQTWPLGKNYVIIT